LPPWSKDRERHVSASPSAAAHPSLSSEKMSGGLF
jgi:hypothetical protein